MRKAFLLFAAFFAFAVAALPAHAQGSISGTVYLNGSPATSNTRVVLLTEQAYLQLVDCQENSSFSSCFRFTENQATGTDTDYNDGTYSFNYVTPGSYVVMAIFDDGTRSANPVRSGVSIYVGNSAQTDNIYLNSN